MARCRQPAAGSPLFKQLPGDPFSWFIFLDQTFIAEAGRLGNAWHLLGTLTKKEARHHRVPALPGGKRPAQLPGTAGLAFSLPARSWPRSRNVRDSLLGSYAGLLLVFYMFTVF